jgi:hypothetical protein
MNGNSSVEPAGLDTNPLSMLLSQRIGGAPKMDDFDFHQGVVQAWNDSTGESTINIAGSAIEDIPMLNIGDTINLAVGNVVAVIRYRTSYFILGRVVIPNSGAFATAAVEFEIVFANASNFAIPTVDATVVSFDLTVPPWANQALVQVNHQLTGFNQHLTELGQIYTSVWITTLGASSSQNAQPVPAPNVIATAYASLADTGAVTPGGTINVVGRAMSFHGSFPADLRNQGHLTGFAIYTRV